MRLVTGVALALLALMCGNSLWIAGLVILDLSCWSWIYCRYRQIRKQYVTVGRGPMPIDAWVNPPPSVMQPGDLLLTAGRVADRLRETVAHGEVVIRDRDGSLKVLSSWMFKGVVINPVERITNDPLNWGHYIILRPRLPLSEEQITRATDIAYTMREINRCWRERHNRALKRFLENLPLPSRLRVLFYRKLRSDGFDWMGLLVGYRKRHSWTCIGTCVEFYDRLGIKTRCYGSGLFGLGSGIFDPIVPVHFLNDHAFRLLTVHDSRDA